MPAWAGMKGDERSSEAAEILVDITAMFNLLQLVSLSLVVSQALAVATWGQCGLQYSVPLPL